MQLNQTTETTRGQDVEPAPADAIVAGPVGFTPADELEFRIQGILGREDRPISLVQIRAAIGLDVSSREVRDALRCLVHRGYVERVEVKVDDVRGFRYRLLPAPGLDVDDQVEIERVDDDEPVTFGQAARIPSAELFPPLLDSLLLHCRNSGDDQARELAELVEDHRPWGSIR